MIDNTNSKINKAITVLLVLGAVSLVPQTLFSYHDYLK